MAVASTHLGVWTWSRQSPELQTECQNGEERWLPDRPDGLSDCQTQSESISQSAQLLGFSRTSISVYV